MTVGGPDWLRAERARLVASAQLDGPSFGRALAAVLDEAFAQLIEAADVGGRWTLMAMGSYGRGELCPGSDVDVMLLTEGRRAGSLDAAARAVWYPLWDAGFVLGHSVRTVKEALAIADDDIEAMTALLDARFAAGDRALADELVDRIGRLARKRRGVLVTALADAADSRREKPGAVAEMLEPDLKQGSGGLRDVQGLAWAGAAIAEVGGLDALVALGYLEPDDRARLDAARAELLDVRLALHRVTGGRSDLLTLQEQDAVAAQLGVTDADELVRSVSAAARAVAWIARDSWSRLRSALQGPARRGGREREVATGIVLRDGRIALPGERVDALTVLQAAVAAAEHGVAFERAALDRCASVETVEWGEAERAAFVALLGAGERAVPVVEALDHVGVLECLLPEWAHVRSRPQRNAYHRFTVDRHLLEAVAQCAALRSETGFDGDVARRCRPDLLLLGALLHDISKGTQGDHSVVGAETACVVAARIGVDTDGTETLAWLVRHHLLLADTATRRDLSEETTVVRFGRAVGTTERLDLLYALTIGDSRATGPAAWSATRAALVRELYLRADALLEAGVVDDSIGATRREELVEHIGAAEADRLLDAFSPSYAATFSAADMALHRNLLGTGELAVDWAEVGDAMLRITVVAPDRPGLLARVAGALAVLGVDIHDANAFSHRSGLALEVFLGHDRFRRLGESDDRARATEYLAEIVAGTSDVEEPLRERRRRYRREPGAVEIRFDLEASQFATVVEVEAPDEVGLLATVASVFADLDLDVTLAKVQTLADRVIDVFYVRDATGAKILDSLALDRLRATLVARLTTEYSLP